MHVVEQELLHERRQLTGLVLAEVVAWVLAGLAVGQGVIYLLGLHLAARHEPDKLPALGQAWMAFGGLALLGFLLAGWKARAAWQKSIRQVGRLRDEKLAASKNRLEASAELSQSSEALAMAQREETAAYLASRPARRADHLLALTTACAIALVLLNGSLASRLIGIASHPSAVPAPIAKKDDAPKPPPFARIDIVSPESETRATPIEEVVVAGKADSDNGFTALSLHASLNGAPDKILPLDPALFAKGGPTKFNDSMLLDQLNAQPFDVVSYYFQGTSRHAKPLTVSSPMQFIEVRPFREDIHKTKGKNGDSQEFNKLTWLIRQQITVSKRAWIIASNQLPPTDPTVISATRETGDAQDKIAASTDELFKEMTAKGYPAPIVDHVSLAGTAMHQAVVEIRKPALLAANPIQRRALGELVEATKNFIRIMPENRAAAVNRLAVQDPFKNKQKTPPPAGPPATNPMVKLKNLIKREQDIVQELASTSAPNKTPANPPEPDTSNPAPLLAHSDLIPPPSDGGPPPQHPEPPSNPPPPGGSSGSPMAGNTPPPRPGQDVPPAPPPSTPDPNSPNSLPTAADQPQKGAGSSPTAADQPKPGDGSSPTAADQPKPGQGPSPSTGNPPKPNPGSSATAANQPQPGQGAPGPGTSPLPSPNLPGAGGSPGDPQMVHDQSQIGHELGQMQDQPGSEAASNTALAEAQAAAHGSADALAAQDRAGALNAARNAEAAMLRANDALAAAASAQLREALAQAQQQLQDAARDQRAATTPTAQAQVAQQVQAVRDALDRLREQQAAAGDPKLANLADSMVRRYGESGLPEKLAGLSRNLGSAGARNSAADLMDKLAGELASNRLAMQSEAKNLEDTLARIDRIQHNMNQAHGTPEEQAAFAQELQGDLKTALSDGNALLPSGNGQTPGPGQTPGNAPAPPGGTGLSPDDDPNAPMHRTASGVLKAPIHPVSPASFQGLREPLAAFREEIQQRLEALRDQEELTYLNPDQSPEQYRAQVAAYYERISREAKAAAPASKPPSP